MAKEAKTAGKTATPTTEENIMDQIRNKNLMTEDAVKAAVEQIAKDADENKKRDAMHAIKRFEYKNARALIELRRRRAEDKATKTYLTKTEEIKNNYLEGKATIIESNNAEKEAEKAKNEEFNKLNNEFDNNVRELRQAYPGYWSYEWDRCW